MQLCKYCVHCRHIPQGGAALDIYECAKGRITHTSLVTGRVLETYTECYKMRADSQLCGEQAKLFEWRTERPLPTQDPFWAGLWKRLFG